MSAKEVETSSGKKITYPTMSMSQKIAPLLDSSAGMGDRRKREKGEGVAVCSAAERPEMEVCVRMCVCVCVLTCIYNRCTYICVRKAVGNQVRHTEIADLRANNSVSQVKSSQVK